MAKKSTKSKAKKAKPKKKPKRTKANDTISKLAAQVLAECAFAVSQSIERRMTSAVPPRVYRLEPAARDFWLQLHLKTIPHALAQEGADWPADRDGVLLMAGILGQRAADNAIADAGTSQQVTITKANVKKASDDTSEDRRCTAGTGGGAGPYCSVA